MPPLTLLIKPVSSSCNMSCDYCFYRDTARKRKIPSYGDMSLSTLENVVKKALAASSVQCTFAFQGGEPTLAGLEFYNELIRIVEKYNNKRLRIQYAIQTNGYNVDKDWATFFSKYHFFVGLSLDGTKDIHDIYRKDLKHKGTYTKVMHTSQLLEKYGVEYNILAVVTAQAAKNIGKIYGFFSRNNFMYQQYIPCIDPIYEERGRQTYSLTPDLYSKFLCTLFDLWYNDFSRGKKISVRYFDNLIQIIMGYPPESCDMKGKCSRQIVVEADGGIYPCDFYVLDEYRLGNINDRDFVQLENKRNELKFIDASELMPLQCNECHWNPLCRGGCRRDRVVNMGSELPLNYFCSAYKCFFDYAYLRLKKCSEYM